MLTSMTRYLSHQPSNAPTTCCWCPGRPLGRPSAGLNGGLRAGAHRLAGRHEVPEAEGGETHLDEKAAQRLVGGLESQRNTLGHGMGAHAEAKKGRWPRLHLLWHATQRAAREALTKAGVDGLAAPL